MLVVEGRGEGLSLAQICQDTPKIAEQEERRAQGEPEIDGLLACVALLWQGREGVECLLEVSHRFAVGRPGHGLLPGLPRVTADQYAPPAPLALWPVPEALAAPAPGGRPLPLRLTHRSPPASVCSPPGRKDYTRSAQ